MAVTSIFANIQLDSATYTSVSLSSSNNFYLIANTQLDNIKSISFAVAVDSGVANKPLFLKNITVNIEEGQQISGNLFTGFPETFYLKPLQVVDKDGNIHVTGTFNIGINVNPAPIYLG